MYAEAHIKSTLLYVLLPKVKDNLRGAEGAAANVLSPWMPI